MKTKLFIALALLSFSLLFAQIGQPYIEQATNFLERGYYSHAEVLMEKAIAQDPHNFDNYYVMFQVQLAKGDLQHAYDNLELYISNASGIDHEYYDKLLKLIEDSVVRISKGLPMYQIGYFPEYLNSEYNDFAPLLSDDGNQLYFTSSRKCKALKENIFVSEKLGASWSQLKPIPTLLTNNNESLNSFSSDGEYIYLFGHYDGRKGIYRAEKVRTAFTTPERIQALSSDAGDLQPYVFEDDVMFFTSNRSGSLGGYDIWVSEYNNGWQEPVNLGSTINTMNDEQTPFISWDGQSLFFASNGHASFGGFDIFRAKKNGPSWTDWDEPINLGPEINTIYNERHYIRAKNSNEAFISSDRADGQGGEDIYKVVILNEEYLDGIRVYGNVVDNYGQPVSVDINWSFIIKDQMKTSVVQSNDKGYYNLYLPRIDSVHVQITRSNYQSYSNSIILTDDIDEMNYDIMLDLLEEKNYVIENIYFDFDKATLKEESFPSLNQLVETIRSNPDISVCIVGHTDNVGSANYNKDLSERRAKSVYQYLIDNGVDSAMLNYRGEGQENPKVPNDTEENRQLNRRVEFVVSREGQMIPVTSETQENMTEPTEEMTSKTGIEEEVIEVEEEVVEEMKIEEEAVLTTDKEIKEETVKETQVADKGIEGETVKAEEPTSESIEVQEEDDVYIPFFNNSENKIITNKIRRMANEYGIESKMKIYLENRDSRAYVTSIDFAEDIVNDSFLQSVKDLLDGWFIPSVEVETSYIEINPLEE